MRAGTIKTMFIAGGLMAVTNLLFAVLAWTEKSDLLFAIAVIADDITAAFATVAFVAFISLLVDRTYTATQYALLCIYRNTEQHLHHLQELLLIGSMEIGELFHFNHNNGNSIFNLFVVYKK